MEISSAIRYLIVLFVAVLFAGCGGGGSSPPPNYSVTATAGSGGSISPSSASVVSGSTTSFSISLNEGYEVAEVTGCGGTLSGTTYTTGSITAACAVNATFKLKKYTVTASAGTGGSISPISTSVDHGSKASFTLTAASGYKISAASGCGGTLSGATFTTAAVTAACAVSATFVLDTPFSADAKLLSDLEPFFQQVCGDTGLGRSLQNVVVNDFDKDGRKDLLLNIWCSPVTSGTDFTGATPSRAIIFKQDSAGNFSERTSDYFGTKPVDLGGVGEYFVMEDFNNDGYKDVIYAVQREDGRRINSPPTTQYAFNVALMSKGSGLYEALPWGSAAWHSQLVLAPNASAQFDVVETSYSQGPQGWRWQGKWETTPGYDWVASTGAQFLTPTTAGKGSEFAVSALSGSLLGVEARKYSVDRWVKTGEFGYAASTIQKLCCGNTAPSGAAFVSIDGKDYVDPSFGMFCELKKTPDAKSEVITNFNANEIVGGYKNQLIVYGQTNLLGTDKLFSFSVDSAGKLQRTTLTIRNELTLDLEPNGISCQDLNSDGNQDILIYATPTKRARYPVIYANDGTGGFDRIKDAALPVAPSSPGFFNYVIEDIDGDGIRDLLYFPINGEKGKPIQIRIHRGLRAINRSDVM